MSMLSAQSDELRLMARLVRDYDYKEISRMLREAANTIEALSAKLNAECELEEVDAYDSAGEPVHVLECSACGETCEHVNGSYPRCPHCGRKAVER